MNLLLLSADEIGSGGTLWLRGRRWGHLTKVRKIAVGDRIAAGVIDGGIGEAEVLSLAPDGVELALTITAAPPAAVPITVLLALPRPKVVRRVLQGLAAFGIKHVVLLGSWRVEKSYWDSPYLKAEAVRAELLTGLEQGGDTVVPRIEMRPRFKPFVEDELTELVGDRRALVAHPAGAPCPHAIGGPAVLAVGPDAGFNDYEVQQLQRRSFEPASLGPRQLRVEQAIPALLGRLT
ncbi:MAG TPA: 16S rRNA (uracil(1498)-N(3))-methyltransferase [Terriglobales bacterium]|nr:16S rRNA (uracil(1498)-N(3))-methyltransferase [Terriglobales bacterium]